jgi:hypothetical protein
VAQNKRLADELGVEHAKCMAHALALVLKHFVSKVPAVVSLTTQISTLINAGGTTRRKDELYKIKLDPRKMQAYPNRFQNVAELVSYILEIFGNIHEWVMHGQNLAELQLDDVDEDDPMGKAEASKTLTLVREAFKSSTAKPLLQAVNTLFKTLPELVKIVSGGNAVEPSILARLKSFHRDIKRAASVEGAEQVIFVLLIFYFVIFFIFFYIFFCN